MKKRILSLIMSALLTSSLISVPSAFSDNTAEYGTITVTVIDEETNELFKEDGVNDDDNFWIMVSSAEGQSSFGFGASSHNQFNSNISNPYTLNNALVNERYTITHLGYNHDGFTYMIDEEKSENDFVYLSTEPKEVKIYMKKDIWADHKRPKQMTLDDVVELSKKGGEFTWADFEAYSGRKCGTPFDMLAYIYEIDESYYLFVSGAVDGAPDQVQFCHYNEHISVDVLTGDVEAFIAENSNYELPDIGYTFDEIYNMTEDEVRVVFNEKGLTNTEKYHVYPQRNGNTAVDNNSMTVLLYPENYMINLTDHELVTHVTDMNDQDKLFKNSDIIWDREKVRKSLGLPKEYFYFEDVSSMGVTKSAPEGEDPDIRKYCQCSIRCTSEDKDKIADLRRAALNYIQLNPDFALVYPETYGGAETVPAATLKGDVNGDKAFDICDIVALQRWLLGAEGAELSDWKAADLCEDGKLDVFDLTAMKKALLAQTAAQF